MLHYGGSLLLNKDNAFGQVCNCEWELKKAINKCYGKNQDKRYKDNYNDIVNFSDKKNSERLIKLLEQDNLIEKNSVTDKLIIKKSIKEKNNKLKLAKLAKQKESIDN